MSDLYKALIAALLSFIVAIITYRYQFNRNRMIDFKGRMRLMYSLIKETIGLTEHAINSVMELTESLNNNNLYMPLLAVSAYPVAEYLKEKVLSDDYYIAYVNAYSSGIDSEKYFFDLKFNTVYIHTQFEQIVTMVKDAYLRDNERRKDFIERHKKAQDIIINLYDCPVEGVQRYVKEIERIGYEFTTTREENDGRGNINEVETHLVVPLLNLLGTTEMVYKELLPLMLHLGEMHHLYRDVTYQNDHMKNDLQELLEPLENSLEIVKKTYKYLSSQQIINLIN